MAAIELNKKKGIPTVKIKVGYMAPATYKSWLKLPNGAKHSLGNDNEIDLVVAPGIKAIKDLVDTTYIWDVRVINITGSPTEKYHVGVTIMQDGAPVHDTIVCEGKFDGANAQWCFDSALFF